MAIGRPTLVQVGPHLYKIHWTHSEWAAKFTDKEIEDSVGRCCPNQCAIYIRSWDGMAKSQQQETLVHELIHATYHVTGFSTQEYTKLEDVEEHSVLMLSPILYGILRDNPDLVEWLQS